MEIDEIKKLKKVIDTHIIKYEELDLIQEGIQRNLKKKLKNIIYYSEPQEMVIVHQIFIHYVMGKITH